MNVLIAGTNPGAVDRVICRIMDIDLKEVPHILNACQIINSEGVDIECDGIEFEKLIRKLT